MPEMEVSQWLEGHWFELLQTAGILAGLFFTAYTVRQDERARRITNLLSIKQQHREIWREQYERPQLFRVRKKDVDLKIEPVSDEEALFVTLLILHLDTVYRAIKSGMFVKIEGMRLDLKEFFSAPIPKSVWENLKPQQDEEFVSFVESILIQPKN